MVEVRFVEWMDEREKGREEGLEMRVLAVVVEWKES